MNQRPTACDSRQIALFLSQQMLETEQSAFESHLESCLACREALQSEAAAEAAWSEAREVLTPNGEETTSDGPATGNYYDSPIGSLLGLLAPTDDPEMIGRLAGYEIVGLIGRGGMGIVLKGFDPRLNRFVAIKTLAPQLAASGSARRRFAREARAAAAVVHENVIAIHGVAEFQGIPYLVMPYVKGESLQKRIDRMGPLGLQEILRIGHQMSAGLAAAHAQGLVHRDIKPANILLEEGVERLQITDFGLARTVDDASETRTGIIAGTPQFMSPEQARGDAVDSRSDLFSVGSVLYQLCTGRPPFRAETPYGILRRITDTDPRPIPEINPDYPDWLIAIIGRLHEKTPERRIESAEKLADLLNRCLAHVQQPAGNALPADVREYLAAAGRRKRGWRATTRTALGSGWRGALGLAILMGAAAAYSMFGPRPQPAEQEARSPANGDSVPPTPSQVVPGWHDSAGDVSGLIRSANELNARANRLWDREPSSPDELYSDPFAAPPSGAAAPAPSSEFPPSDSSGFSEPK